MAIKVLVVDDSGFFRRRLGEILGQDNRLSVVGFAVNGQDAIRQVMLLQPDVITMDLEMPIMDGLAAIKQIMQMRPTPILIFSSLTHQGMKATLDALDAGALDFLPKTFTESAASNYIAAQLCARLVDLATRKKPLSLPQNMPPPANLSVSKTNLQPNKTKLYSASTRAKLSVKGYQIVVIGASTGGPVALQHILTALPANFPLPILVVQHMPKLFTTALANRLNTFSKLYVKEAKTGDVLKAGEVYLAPGGMQTLIDGSPRCAVIKIIPDENQSHYKPCVDVTLESLASVYQGDVLCIILTGMGIDGCKGSNTLKRCGSTIWSQDEASSIVYGMPKAVFKQGISSESLPLDSIAKRILIELNLV